jgi:AcrR family transcriptional regulator
MSRTVNPQENSQKRKEILDVAQRLVFTKGYERMTVQDILAELRISSGAFYHYFDTKPALLAALLERMLGEAEQPLRLIVQDPALTALEKLQRFFAAFDQMRSAARPFLTSLMRVWYADDNALIRQKVEEATLKRRAALLTSVVHQGMREGVFTTAYPDQAGAVIQSLVRGMELTHARLLLGLDQAPDDLASATAIVAAHSACMDAIERVLGIPSASLYRTDPAAAQAWVTALHTNKQEKTNKQG